MLAVKNVSEEEKHSSLLRSKERDKREKHVKPSVALSECCEYVKLSGDKRPSISYRIRLCRKSQRTITNLLLPHITQNNL